MTLFVNAVTRRGKIIERLYVKYNKIIDIMTHIINTKQKKFGYIYLLREREFLHKNENVFKYGKTCTSEATLILPRLKNYKQGSELLMIRQVPVQEVDEIKKHITNRFKAIFTKHDDGNEYFIGDPNLMIDEIFNIINSKLQTLTGS